MPPPLLLGLLRSETHSLHRAKLVKGHLEVIGVVCKDAGSVDQTLDRGVFNQIT